MRYTYIHIIIMLSTSRVCLNDLVYLKIINKENSWKLRCAKWMNNFIQRSIISSLPVFQSSSSTVLQSSNLPVSQSPRLQVFLSSSLPIFQFFSIPVFLSSSLPVHKFSSLPVFQSSSLPV